MSTAGSSAHSTPSPDLWVCHLGTVRYDDALALQERVRAARLEERLPDTLLLLEHPAVYTRGRRTGAQDLPFSPSFYAERGIEVVDTDRGGRITYHGPGQLVGYPIMRVADVGRHLRAMEAAIVDALAAEGLAAHARVADGPDFTGVWVGAPGGADPDRAGAGPARASTGERKIASIGVHVQRGVSTHGFAVNVVNDLRPWEWIVPCGLQDVRMTSLQAERPGPATGADAAWTDAAGRHAAEAGADEPDATRLGAPAPDPDAACATRLRCFRRRVAASFCDAHDRRQRLVTAAALERALRDPAGRAQRRVAIVLEQIEPVPA